MEKKKGKEKKNRIFFWMEYSYKEIGYPLFFVSLKLSEVQICRILRVFDEAYGCLPIETPLWALEFQLLTRMLVSKETAMLLNPYFLEVREEGVQRQIREILGEESYRAYDEHLHLSVKQAMEILKKEQEDLGIGE